MDSSASPSTPQVAAAKKGIEPDHYLDAIMSYAKYSDSTPDLLDNFQETFTPFPRLPENLQAIIIAIAVKESVPRIVTVSVISQGEKHRLRGVPQQHIYDSDLLKTTSRTPHLTHTSSQIRIHASAAYGRVAGERYGEEPIWFNFDADTLHVSNSHTWFVMFGQRLNRGLTYTSPQMEETIESLRYLTLAVPFKNDFELEVKLLKKFPRLKVLTLQKMMSVMEVTMDSKFLVHMPDRRTLEDGHERFTEERQIPRDLRKRGDEEKPVVLWRKAEVLKRLAARYINQPSEPKSKPLIYSQAWFNKIYGW